MKWSPQEDAVLRGCAKRGESFGICAEALRRKRNEVAGRAHRLGVTFNCSHEIRSETMRQIAYKRWDEGGKAAFGFGQ